MQAQLGLAAEHGYYMRLHAGEEWEVHSSHGEFAWKEMVLPILQVSAQLAHRCRSCIMALCAGVGLTNDSSHRHEAMHCTLQAPCTHSLLRMSDGHSQLTPDGLLLFHCMGLHLPCHRSRGPGSSSPICRCTQSPQMAATSSPRRAL